MSPARKANPDPAPPAAPPEPPASPPVPQPLPGKVQAAAILLLVFGTLAGLCTAFMVLMMLMFAAVPMGPFMGPAFPGVDPGTGIPDGMWGVDYGWMWWSGLVSVLVMGAVGAVVTGAHVAAGIAVLQRRGWGRILGMVVSGVALVLLVLALGSMLLSVLVPMPVYSDPGWRDPAFDHHWANMTTASTVFGIVVIGFTMAAYAFVLWVLAKRGDVFE